MTPTMVGEHAKRAELATEIASIGVVKTVPGVSMKSRTRPVMRYTGLVERSGQELAALWTDEVARCLTDGRAFGPRHQTASAVSAAAGVSL